MRAVRTDFVTNPQRTRAIACAARPWGCKVRRTAIAPVRRTLRRRQGSSSGRATSDTKLAYERRFVVRRDWALRRTLRRRQGSWWGTRWRATKLARCGGRRCGGRQKKTGEAPAPPVTSLVKARGGRTGLPSLFAAHPAVGGLGATRFRRAPSGSTTTGGRSRLSSRPPGSAARPRRDLPDGTRSPECGGGHRA